MEENKRPPHLDGIFEIKEKIFSYPPDDEEYAKIAFTLIEASNGDKDAVKTISAYIQQQHRKIKDSHDKLNSLKGKINTWIGWASYWTDERMSPRNDQS